MSPTNFYGRMVRHLEQLKQALENQNVLAHVSSPSEGRVGLQIPDLTGDVTCEPNPQDLNHLWYFHNNEPLTPVDGPPEAQIAAAKLLRRRARALTTSHQ